MAGANAGGRGTAEGAGPGGQIRSIDSSEKISPAMFRPITIVDRPTTAQGATGRLYCATPP